MADRVAPAPRDEHDVRAVVRRIVEAIVEPGSPMAAGQVASAPEAPDTAESGGGPGGDLAAAHAPIAIGADHGGYALKERIRRALAEQGHVVRDCGTSSEDAVDYPDFALAVGRLVADGTCAAGIVIDGAGIGSSMAANKVPGIRAALCYDLSTARNSREHNHANVLTLGARLTGTGLALDIVAAWLGTRWGPGRHAARVAKITEIERRYAGAAAGSGTR